jgi:formylglycine-generating enzyme required for sulfatase activity
MINSRPALSPPQTFSFETVTLDRKGEVIRRAAAQAQKVIQDLENGIALELVAIPKGFFQMGSRNEGGYEDELPLHPVFLDAFWLGTGPVTQAQWQAVMGGLPNCRFHGPDRPVDTICWRDALSFCERLTRRTGHRYALPSEAQWEYACRAGTITPFSLGETITTDYVNFVGDHTYREAPVGIYRHGTTPVGTFAPNPWGLYDMHGNVWEFCADLWTSDYTGATASGNPAPAGPLPARLKSTRLAGLISTIKLAFLGPENTPTPPGDATYHVSRGGSWHETPGHCRSAVRLRVAENDRMEYYGLRVMLKEG